MDRGAHFYKADLQVHTPRDLNWKGAGATTEEERRQYAQEFVAACRARGLGAVGITDHHDTAFFSYIKRAAAEESNEQGKELPVEQQLVVFPGMELTLGVPCQALLLFDAAFPENMLAAVVTALAIKNDAPASAGKHGPIERLEHIQSFSDLYARLNEQPYLLGRFIVLPHVGESGNFSLLRKAFAAKYKEMPCVGGFVDGSLSQHGHGNADIVEGKDKAWGNKALGLFQTSDNRHRTFELLGKFHTWVKWARPTAEALRQACLARRSRISQVEPALPPIRVLRIEVSNSKFLGPLQVELNRQYNALIGGRGTGKSSVLEYLRWALCDQPIGSSSDDLADFQQRRASLIEKTLKPLDASVQVSVLLNNTEHVVRRHVDGRLLLKIGPGEFRPSEEAEVRVLLPIQAYSQKQLSSVGIKAEELRRFVHLPIQPQLDAVASRLNDLAARIRSAHDALREHRRVTKENTTAHTEHSSIQQQLTTLREGLKGVSKEDRFVIAAQPAWANAQRTIDTWRTELGDIVTKVRELRTRLKKGPTAGPGANVAEQARLTAMEQLLKDVFKEVGEHLAGAEEAAFGPSTTIEKLRAAGSSWDEAAAANRARYEAAKGKAAESEQALKQIDELERRQRELVGTIATRDRRLAELGDPEVQYAQLRQDWKALHAERTGQLQAQCERLGLLSKNLLRVTLKRGAAIEHITTALRELAKGSKMRTEKFDQLMEGVSTAPDPVAAWLEVVDELRALSELDQPASSPLPSCPRLGSAQVTDPDRRKLAERLVGRGWAEFAVLELEDVPRFEYRAREAEYIEFSDASAGQQATALMFVLLNQDGPPLVIDQPEDDLDNHVIQKVVEEVWTAKTKRQLIFSSHNANLVVNGDAELVACCDYRTAGDQSGGCIKVQGAIDISEVRAEIAAVMEGGREAFTLRKEKYGF